MFDLHEFDNKTEMTEFLVLWHKRIKANRSRSKRIVKNIKKIKIPILTDLNLEQMMTDEILQYMNSVNCQIPQDSYSDRLL